MKKLGIILPTYNRAKFALEGLLTLLPQLIANKDKTYLLISDNASPDNTEELLKPIAEEHPDIITYVRQRENIGAHANFYYGINNIDAEYIYLLGDDDIVSPNFVDIILNLIDAHPGIGMIHFNYLEGKADLKNISIHHKDVKSEKLYNNYACGSDFIKSFLVAPSFMSSDVFRKDCMLKGKQENYHPDCYGYDWLLSLYTGILDKECLYYELPLVIQRYGNAYPRFALNTILGQQRIFVYLEKYIPGISAFWMNIVAESPNTLRAIRSITNYQSTYRPYHNEMKTCLSLTVHRNCLFIANYFPKIVAKMILTFVMGYYKIKRQTSR